jgi:hypothetical protein
MPISVTCACGRSLRVKDEAAGRKVSCTACGTAVAVPRPDDRQDVEDEAFNLLMAAPDRPTSESNPVSAQPSAEETARPPSRPHSSPAPANRSSSASRPKRFKSQEEKEGRGFSIAVHPSIIVGLLMLLGAVVWFFLGLAAGRIFFYPPIMFVLGIGAIIRGFKGQE